MIDRIINMVIRQVVRKLVGQGVNAAMKKGGEALSKRGQRKQSAVDEPLEIEQSPADTSRRRLHPDERKGDEVLYPTDDYTDGMQPRR
ncbi:MAG: hypothetical protein AAFN79_00190 [Pseudomonadota bacterium]